MEKKLVKPVRVKTESSLEKVDMNPANEQRVLDRQAESCRL